MNPPGPNFYFMALQAGFLPFEPDRLEYRCLLPQARRAIFPPNVSPQAPHQ